MNQPANNPFTVIETPSLDQLAQNLLAAKAVLIQFANGSVVAV